MTLHMRRMFAIVGLVILFSLFNISTTEASVKKYDGTLSNKHYVVTSNGGECNMFNLHLNNGKRYQVCLDPTDNPNADNGKVRVTFQVDQYSDMRIYQTIKGKVYSYRAWIVK